MSLNAALKNDQSNPEPPGIPITIISQAISDMIKGGEVEGEINNVE